MNVSRAQVADRHVVVWRFGRRVTNQSTVTAAANRTTRPANKRPYRPAGPDVRPAAGWEFDERHGSDETRAAAPGVVTTLLDPIRLVVPGVALLVPVPPVVSTGGRDGAISNSLGPRPGFGGSSGCRTAEMLAS